MLSLQQLNPISSCSFRSAPKMLKECNLVRLKHKKTTSTLLSILDSCRTIYSKIDETLRYRSTFVLHRSKWESLAKSCSYLLDRISYHLHLCNSTKSEIYETQRVVEALEKVHDTIERCARFLQHYCIPVNSDFKSLHHWLVNRAIHLVTSTDVLDCHLHDLLWSYAALLMSLRDIHPEIAGIVAQYRMQMPNIGNQKEVELRVLNFLREEIDALDQIWTEADTLTEQGNEDIQKLLNNLMSYNHETVKKTKGIQNIGTCKLLAGFIKDKLSWVNMRQPSNSETSLPLPGFLWRETQEIIIQHDCGKSLLTEWMGGQFAGKVIENAMDREELEKQVEIQARLYHPNLLHLVCFSWCQGDTEVHPNKVYLLTELIDHPADLHSFMTRRVEEYEINPPFKILPAVELMLQVAKGMEHLHSAEIMHTDLKASNILVKMTPFIFGSSNDINVVRQLKISDFGIFKWKPADSSDFCNSPIRSWPWMAPEVMDDAENQQSSVAKYSYEADVYSFAIVCWEILTGKLPFESCCRNEMKDKVMCGQRPNLPGDCPSALRNVIEKCWHQNPSQRPSFKQICDMLRYVKASILLDSFHDVTISECSERMNVATKHLLIPAQMLAHELSCRIKLHRDVAEYESWCKTEIVKGIENGKWEFWIDSTKVEMEEQFRDFFGKEILEHVKTETGNDTLANEFSQISGAQLLEFFLQKAEETLGTTALLFTDLDQIIKQELGKAFNRVVVMKMMGWRVLRDLMDYHLTVLLEKQQVQHVISHVSNESNHYLIVVNALDMNLVINRDRLLAEWKNLLEATQNSIKYSTNKQLTIFLTQLRKKILERVDNELADGVFRPIYKAHSEDRKYLDRSWLYQYERLPKKLCESLKQVPMPKIDFCQYRSRCEASCPQCGSACFHTKGHDLETIKHDCVHQPAGLAGSTYGPEDSQRFRQLTELSCIMLANLHADWESTPSHYSGVLQLREYIFCSYQEQLERYFSEKNAMRCPLDYMPAEYQQHELNAIKNAVKSRLKSSGIDIQEIDRQFRLKFRY